MSPRKSPFFELRSGAVDTLLFVVKTTDLGEMRAELTRRFEATPEFFANDVVAIDVRRLAEDERVPLAEIAALLDSVRMRPIGVVADAAQHAWVSEANLPLLEARDRRPNTKAAGEDEAQAADETAAPASAAVAAASAAEGRAAAAAASQKAAGPMARRNIECISVPHGRPSAEKQAPAASPPAPQPRGRDFDPPMVSKVWTGAAVMVKIPRPPGLEIWPFRRRLRQKRPHGATRH